jgi:hypothetical protein
VFHPRPNGTGSGANGLLAGQAGQGLEGVLGNLVANGDPLPLSELISVGESAVAEPVARHANSADRAIDLVQHRLIVDVDDAGVDALGNALRAGQIGPTTAAASP